MKKSLLILTTFLSVSSFSHADNLPTAYKQALSELDIVRAELQGDFLSVTFNRDKIGKIMLESVITNICYQMYLDKKFAKKKWKRYNKIKKNKCLERRYLYD